MIYNTFCIGLDFKTAFGKIDIADNLGKIVSATLIRHIPELHSGNIPMALRPIKLLYSFLECLHIESILLLLWCKGNDYFLFIDRN